MARNKGITDDQLIAALKEHGSQRLAAKALGINRRCLQRRLPFLRKRGWAPEFDYTHPVPEGFLLKGNSTLRGPNGEIKLQWIKSQADQEQWERIAKAAIAAMSEDIPRAEPIKAPLAVATELLNQYTITDYHLGMLSWHEETGADWDIEIAEDTLVAWFAEAIARAPDAAVAVFAQLGDLLHWDGMDAVTPASKHLLDADTRFQKLVRVVIRVLRRVIAMLLAKHQHVHIIMAEGNHDPASSIWLREMLTALYENEPRVTVEISPDPYYCYEWGSTALFYHHGHKKKPQAIDSVFVGKFREVFGRTRHAYAHMGHMHHAFVIESNLMKVEQHRTLASPDAYASRGGWLSGRDASVITYHREFGDVGRVVVSSQMLQQAA